MDTRLTTDRLVLRPLDAQDAPRLVELLNVRAIHETTLQIPFPYTLEDAEFWIKLAGIQHEDDQSFNLSIRLRETDELMGGIGMRDFDRDHLRAEMGFWIGVPYWNQGYMTEAVRAVLDYGFGTLGLHRIWAGHLVGNNASGRVQQKAGMTREGVLRHQFCKDGRWVDDVVYAILKDEWKERCDGDGH